MTHGGNTENSIFKLRNFINISSFHNLLDVIYTEISGTMKQFTVWIGMKCDRLLFDKTDNCALNSSISDSGLVVNENWECYFIVKQLLNQKI